MTAGHLVYISETPSRLSSIKLLAAMALSPGTLMSVFYWV